MKGGKAKAKSKVRAKAWKKLRRTNRERVKAVKHLSPAELERLERLERDLVRRAPGGRVLDQYTTGVRRVVSGGLPTLGRRR